MDNPHVIFKSDKIENLKSRISLKKIMKIPQIFHNNFFYLFTLSWVELLFYEFFVTRKKAFWRINFSFFEGRWNHIIRNFLTFSVMLVVNFSEDSSKIIFMKFN